MVDAGTINDQEFIIRHEVFASFASKSKISVYFNLGEAKMAIKISRVIAIWMIVGSILQCQGNFPGYVVLAAIPDTPEQNIVVMGSFEVSAIAPVLAEFTNQTGITTTFQKETDLSTYLLNCAAAKNCPDVAIGLSPNLMIQLAQQGIITPLDALLPSFDTHYGATWRKIGSVGTTLFGLPVNVSSKSMVFYRPQSFADIGATTPSNWTGMLNLADSFVAHGLPPFSIGAESGAASGWPLTDIFENLLVRVGGPDIHRKLVDHDISWTHPIVIETMQYFNDIVGQNNYLTGGISAVRTTFFGDALTNLFNNPPTGAMYFGANWIGAYLDPSAIPLVDYNYFEFPEINHTWGKPIVGGAEIGVLFSASSSVQSFMQFLATPEGSTIWVTSLDGHISPNKGVLLTEYTDPVDRLVAQQLANTNEFLFDLDDQLPSELQTYIWGKLMDFVDHPDQVLTILGGIEIVATTLQGPPYQVFLPTIRK